MRCSTPLFVLAVTVIAVLVPSLRAYSDGNISYIPYIEAKPILEALSEVLPAQLRSPTTESMPTLWPKWVASRDAEIRARLAQGDEDSLINFLLFGTSFTRSPRITLNVLAQVVGKPWQTAPTFSPETAAFVKAISARADDLLRAMASPRGNERLLFALQLMESKGYNVKSPASRQQIKGYLVSNLARMLNEQAGYARILDSARLMGDPSAEFAEKSKLYSTRGLSSDTSLLPNFAIERALASLKSKGLTAPGSVRRVGIIGPGLDFTDKEDGYDFYPQQTIQPFAIIDSLLRLGLASASDLRIVTFDLSPRVNDHLRRARARARQGGGYTIQLPRDAHKLWTGEAIDYWSRFGETIGAAVSPVPVPAGLGDLKVRAVRVRPAVVSLITPEDINIVLQRPELPAGQGFDLLIATNILVYYDLFEQCLALANIERMLRPGGFLLSNNAVLELPSSSMHSVGYETVVYSDRPNDGDHIVWYQRAPLPARAGLLGDSGPWYYATGLRNPIRSFPFSLAQTRR
ncbi:MAG TPA: hypothetical protein VGL29_03240 [Blastocatellia bacterium]|jgi:hypothetical protein